MPRGVRGRCCREWSFFLSLPLIQVQFAEVHFQSQIWLFKAISDLFIDALLRETKSLTWSDPITSHHLLYKIKQRIQDPLDNVRKPITDKPFCFNVMGTMISKSVCQ
jgi:hypothetical protein